LGFDELAAAGPFVFGWAAAVELPPNQLLMIPMVPTPAPEDRQTVVRAGLLGPERPRPDLVTRQPPAVNRRMHCTVPLVYYLIDSMILSGTLDPHMGTQSARLLVPQPKIQLTSGMGQHDCAVPQVAALIA
jgi:hypothetical protein